MELPSEVLAMLEQEVAQLQVEPFSIADLLAHAERDGELWEKICREIDRNDPSMASDYLRGIRDVSDSIQLIGDSIWIIMTAFHNVCGCLAAVHQKIPVPYPNIAKKLPCTQVHFRIVKTQHDTYALSFSGERCPFIAQAERAERKRPSSPFSSLTSAR